MGPKTRTRSKVAAGKKAEKVTAGVKSAKPVPTRVAKKLAIKNATTKKPTTKKAKAEPVVVEIEEEEEEKEEEEEDEIPENNVRLTPDHVKQLKLIRRNVNKWRKYLSDAIKNEHCCPGLLQVEDVFFDATSLLHGINVDVGFYEPKEESEPEETEADTESETEPEPEETTPERPALGPAAAYC